MKSYGKGEYNFVISDEYEGEWKDHKYMSRESVYIEMVINMNENRKRVKNMIRESAYM